VLLPRLLRAVPPDSVLQALNRFDPLPLLPGLEEALPQPDPSVLRSAGARTAARAVVKIEGTSCEVGTQGSGWVVRRGLVATNAHVIAGHDGTRVFAPNGQVVGARPVYVDAANDIALLRVRGLRVGALSVSSRGELPRPVALLGYPRNGPLTATAATAGEPRTVLSPDAYGRRVRPRLVVPLRGAVQPGESGGPVVDRRGRVVAMIFGGTRRGGGGYAVPVNLVLDAAGGPLRAVSSGPCIVR
jgi:S1-C subfamily serine protease